MQSRYGLVIAGVIALGICYWAFAGGARATFDLDVPGKGKISYDCALTSTKGEARLRATAAHSAFLAGIEGIAADAAEALQAAMLKANETGDTNDIQAASADYKAKAKDLRAKLLQEFNCRVDSTLQQ